MSTVLITGVNRGIGRGLLETYLSRPNTTVIGSVRNAATASDLTKLPAATGSKLELVSYELTSASSAATMVADIKSRGISHIDVVIANAGLYELDAYKDMAVLEPESITKYVDVNAVSVLRLFQATLPLLRAAAAPKFVGVTSISGSISSIDLFTVSMGSYGVSKVALNFVLRSMHHQVPEITTILLHPGGVQTENALGMTKEIGLSDVLTVTVDESVTGMMKLIDGATREQSGIFYQWDGGVVAW